MQKQKINIVWMKRDIRSQDHAPLFEAEMSNLPYLIVFFFEPSLMQYPDTSLRHLQFQYHSIQEINNTLKEYNREVLIFNTEAMNVFKSILEQYHIEHLYSYQESGTTFTYDRDKKIKFFCKENKIEWTEFQRDGIIRGINNRKDWDKKWYATMHSPTINNTFSKAPNILFENLFHLSPDLKNELEHYPKEYQPPGELFAFKYLNSFVSERGKNYSKNISKPLESRKSCIRISPYISWGNISIKQVYQFINTAVKNKTYPGPLKNAMTRLKWHCHFIQKFEMECSYETSCLNLGYELLLHDKNERFIMSWKNGKTGFPLIDACMLCLQTTGWLNFRMRAMLVSFFCHHLFQDWREGTYHLAKLFLDYEPGIHYPQFQMQAGTTGINTIRIYNPVKQSQDHDPDGVFIKLWLPNLEYVPSSFIHEPYKMTEMEQQLYKVIIGKDYPKPIVTIETTGKYARNQIWGHRKNEKVQQENKKIIFKHTRNKKNENIS